MITLFNFKTFHSSGKVRLGMVILVNTFLLAKLFFSTLFRFSGSAFVYLLRKLGRNADKRCFVVYKLKESAAHKSVDYFAFVVFNSHLPYFNGSNAVFMACKEADLTAVKAGYNKSPSLTVVENTVGCHDFQFEGIHTLTPFL